jgi:hypothetical protein
VSPARVHQLHFQDRSVRVRTGVGLVSKFRSLHAKSRTCLQNLCAEGAKSILGRAGSVDHLPGEFGSEFLTNRTTTTAHRTTATPPHHLRRNPRAAVPRDAELALRRGTL